MPTCTICLLRHAEVDDAWQGRIYGSLDVPLSARGREQSAAAAEALVGVPFRAVLSSGLERAEHTARRLGGGPSASDREPRPEAATRARDARLREIDRGRWAGWNQQQVEADQPGGWDTFWQSGGLHQPPEGESLAQLGERVVAALDEHAARHAPGPIAVVAHKWVLRIATAHALGWPPELCTRLEIPYAGMVVLDWTVGGAHAPRLVAVSPRAQGGW